MDFVVPPGQECGDGVHRYFQRPAVDGSVHVDLRGAKWFEPVGLVTLAAHIEAHRERGRPVHVTAPTDTEKANYVARMGLRDMCSMLGATTNLAPVRRNEVPPGTLLELQRVDGESVVRLANALFEAALTVQGEDVAARLREAMVEVGDNVGVHSGRSNGWVAAQVTDKMRTLRFAVGDSGNGIRASLRTAGYVVSDADALRLAIKKGVTSTGQISRGRGLASVVDLLRPGGGNLYIASGGAEITVWPRRETVNTHSVNLRGTIVQGTLVRG